MVDVVIVNRSRVLEIGAVMKITDLQRPIPRQADIILHPFDKLVGHRARDTHNPVGYPGDGLEPSGEYRLQSGGEPFGMVDRQQVMDDKVTLHAPGAGLREEFDAVRHDVRRQVQSQEYVAPSYLDHLVRQTDGREVQVPRQERPRVMIARTRQGTDRLDPPSVRGFPQQVFQVRPCNPLNTRFSVYLRYVRDIEEHLSRVRFNPPVRRNRRGCRSQVCISRQTRTVDPGNGLYQPAPACMGAVLCETFDGIAVLLRNPHRVSGVPRWSPLSDKGEQMPALNRLLAVPSLREIDCLSRVNDYAVCALDHAQITGILPDGGRFSPFRQLDKGTATMGTVEFLLQDPRRVAGLAHPVEYTAQVEVMQNDDPRVPVDEIEHVPVVFRVAEMVEDAVIEAAVLFEPTRGPDREIGREPGVGHLRLVHDDLDSVITGQIRQEFPAIVGNL